MTFWVATITLRILLCVILATQEFVSLPGQERPASPTGVADATPKDKPKFPSSMEETGPNVRTHGHPTETNPGRNAHDSGHGAEIAGIAAGSVGTLLLIDGLAHHEALNKLKKEGPQFPKAFDMNDLRIKAFIGDNWPIAIDYALPGTVEANCEVTAGKKTGIFSLPVTHGKRRTLMSRIPHGFAEKLQAGTYRIHLDTSKGIPVAASGWPGLRIYGVAAGPRAVGSVGVDQLSFGPSAIHMNAGEFALFGFHSHSDFDSVKAEFQIVAPHQGSNLVGDEETLVINPVSEDERVTGLHWVPKKARLGDHMLRIIAWRGIDRGAEWVSSFSADLVNVEK